MPKLGKHSLVELVAGFTRGVFITTVLSTEDVSVGALQRYVRSNAWVIRVQEGKRVYIGVGLGTECFPLSGCLVWTAW